MKRELDDVGGADCWLEEPEEVEEIDEDVWRILGREELRVEVEIVEEEEEVFVTTARRVGGGEKS